MRTVSVKIVERPVQEDRYTVAFTVSVFDAFVFKDADSLSCTVYKVTGPGPLPVQAVPILVKRPATVGLYDGSFIPSGIAAGDAPETYLVTVAAQVGVDSRTWGQATMVVGPFA